MLKHFIGGALVLTLAAAGTAHAGPLSTEQPYFTYSPGAIAFEDINWTPLEFAAFAAYGGYFANIRRPRFETPLPQLFLDEPAFGIEDEVKIHAETPFVPTFLPQQSAFTALNVSSTFVAEPLQAQPESIPEPGTLALVGLGLLGASRSLRRRVAR